MQTNYKRLNFFFPSPFPNLLLTYQTVVEEKLWGFNQELFTGVPEIWPKKTTLGFVPIFFCLLSHFISQLDFVIQIQEVCTYFFLIPYEMLSTLLKVLLTLSERLRKIGLRF